MRFKYLGTAASEGWPALFCECEYCETARSRGGREIRTRSQAIINDDLLIDFPADTFAHMQRFGLHLGRINNLLVTHSHGDHFSVDDLEMRAKPFALGLKDYTLNIYCNDGVIREFERKKPIDLEESRRKLLIFHEVKAFETFNVGDYTVTAFPAQHMKTEQALLFLIEKGCKSVFYGNDTGKIYDEVIDYLAVNKKRIDLLSLDCTKCNEEQNYDSHMNLADIVAVKEKMEKRGIIDNKSIVVANHFSHNGHGLYRELSEEAAKYGVLVSFDGMEFCL